MLLLLLAMSGPEWFSRGSELHEAKSYAEAISAYEKSIGERHLIPQSHAMIARVLARMGKAKEALAELAKAADLEFANAPLVKSAEDFAPLRESEGFAVIMGKIERNAKPCPERPLRRKFDFWLGEWEVTGKAGNPAGTNVIRSVASGCAISESWTSASGGAGSSVTYYDPGAAQWRQNWVDASGANVDFRGGFEGESLVFRATGYRGAAKVLRTMTFTPLAEGKVRQWGQVSSDGGTSWTTEYDLTYSRKR